MTSGTILQVEMSAVLGIAFLAATMIFAKVIDWAERRAEREDRIQ
jgi:ABC-type amino acid transport system permease subunit